MSDPALEPRSFGEDEPERETADTFDTVASSALIHRVRWHTGLSQSEFAAAYHIDPDHLRELERGLVQPDSALVAYLTVIDRAPEVVRAALTTC
jgi:putative transcriptional regulator